MMDIAICAAARPGQRRLVYRCVALIGAAAGLVIRVPGRPGSKTKRITWRESETGGVITSLPILEVLIIQRVRSA
jgi:hypothetical protein